MDTRSPGLIALLLTRLITVKIKRIIEEYGLDDYLPSKYWILAFPAWLTLAVLFIWLIYFAINERLADQLDYYKHAFQS